jgi:transcriptional regulator with XRE-family HTH domain
MTTEVVPGSDAQTPASFRHFIAAEVRAQLARRRISGRQLARVLDESHTWVNRRLSGSTAMDADDIERIATVLGMTPMQIFVASPAGMQAVDNGARRGVTAEYHGSNRRSVTEKSQAATSTAIPVPRQRPSDLRRIVEAARLVHPGGDLRAA